MHDATGFSKVLTLFVLLVCLIAALLAYVAYSGRHGQGWFGLGLSHDKRRLADKAVAFFEDLQFKDFDRAASYHSPADRDGVDIPLLLERIFLIKPEFIDIRSYEITRIDIDRSGLRARVFVDVLFRIVNAAELRGGKQKDDMQQKEVILYFHQEQPNTWYMKLESSLH